MKKCLLAVITLLVLSAGVIADDTPAKSSTVGGGIPNPWRNPWRTAVMVQGIAP
jgi:hypothetical protein